MIKKINNFYKKRGKSLKEIPPGEILKITDKEISGLQEIEEAFRAGYPSPTYRLVDTPYGPEMFCEIYHPTLH